MTKVIMIYLDAFSSTYLNPDDAPALYRLSQKGYGTQLKSMFAFSGIGAALLSGTLPNTNKLWCDYVFSQKTSSSSALFKWFLRICDIIPQDILSQYARYPIHRVFRQPFATPNLIPPNLLAYFKVKQTAKLTEDNALDEIPTLFDQFRNHSIKYYITGLSESISDKWTMKRAFEALKEDYDFILVKLGALDHLGHKHGPQSQPIRQKLLEIDGFVSQFAEKCAQLLHDVHLVVFSDHGMNPVIGTVNLFESLKQLPILMGDDYFVFLNSTVANFWFKNRKAERIVIDVLRGTGHGKILDETRLTELGIDAIGTEYGELLFALDEGYVFFPDFYRKRTVPKGMHGYAYSTYDAPLLLFYSLTSREQFEVRDIVQHIDIMPTVLELMDLPIPLTCEGRSLVQKVRHVNPGT